MRYSETYGCLRSHFSPEVSRLKLFLRRPTHNRIFRIPKSIARRSQPVEQPEILKRMLLRILEDTGTEVLQVDLQAKLAETNASIQMEMTARRGMFFRVRVGGTYKL